MRRYYYTILILLASLMSSCKNDAITFGTVEYYPKFLWKDASITPVQKTFDFDFSEDARNDKNSYAEFQFVDNDGKPISPSELIVYVNGERLKNNIFRVNSDEETKTLSFEFAPDVKKGKHQGYLKLINHNLDRLDSQELTPGQPADVLQWTLRFDKGMNPVVKVLMWIGIVLVSGLLIWIILLRPIFFPRFRAIRKNIIIPNQAPINIRFKGARMVVIDNVKHKQNVLNKVFTGKIIYKYHPAINSTITLIPSNKGRKVLFKASPTSYTCTPNPISLQPSTVTDLVHGNNFVIQ